MKNFAAWACDPARSLEERFGAEILIEQNLGLWRNKHGIAASPTNYEAERLRTKDRQLNPGYEPQFTRADAEHVEEILPEIKSFNNSIYEDRPIRDLSFVRFCEGLESFEIRYCEINDWTPLLSQPTLTKLNIWGTTARDLRCLGQLTRLQNLRLWPHAPWPDLAGFENLVELRTLSLHGNILALMKVPILPQLRTLEVAHGYGFSLPLRSVADLPDMPELRCLHLDNTTELHGIERYAKLINAVIYGYFTDLTPLVALQELTHLTLSGGEYTSFAPLARLSQLRRLVVRNEEPADFTPLAEAPRLHEIALESCPITPVELTSLQATLAPWSEEFAVPIPRPLAPLQLLFRAAIYDTDDEDGLAARDWNENEEMAISERVWLSRQTNQRLTKLLGKGWGGERSEHCWSSTMMHVTICRPEDLDRIPEIVQCLRETLAMTRYPSRYFFVVDPEKWYERDLDDIYQAEDEEFNAEREREEWEYQKDKERERREFLERKYRHRLQQESGLPTKSEDFAPPKNASEENANADAEDTVTAGDTAASPAYDLGTDISLYATLTEKACYFNEHYVAGAQYYLGYKPIT